MNHVDLISPVFTQDAAEHFLEAFAKVFGDQSVHNGIDTGVGIGHAVRQKPEGVCCLVKRKVSIQVAQDHHMVRQPANAEEHSDDDDHFGDFALGPLRFGHAIQGVDGRPQVLDSPSVREAHDEHGDDVAKQEGARVQHLTVLLLPAGDAHRAVGVINQVIVAEIRPCEDQGKTPDNYHGNHSITRGSQLPGAQWVANGQISVKRKK